MDQRPKTEDCSASLKFIQDALDAFRRATPGKRAEAIAFLREQRAKREAGKV
ncbi:MAG: hypothetical protein ACTHNN_12785 [Xanthobacteraceae bacterium]